MTLRARLAAGLTPAGGDRNWLAVGLAVVSALLWGLWWVPIRLLEAGGAAGAWANLAMVAGALPILLAMRLATGGRRPMSAGALAGALCIGVGATSYGVALAHTEVVRALLLFYLAPAWSTAIECLFLGRRWSPGSLAALLASLTGILVIHQGEMAASGWNLGDLLALASGLGWSAGAALVFSSPGVGAVRLTLAMTLGAAASGALFALAIDAGRMPAADDMAGVLLLALASGGIYFAPLLVATMWTVHRLPPATMSFLLTAEIISGVGSSTLALGERFGLVRAAGAALIALGAALELLLPRRLR